MVTIKLPTLDIKAIIGLGNPGAKYAHTRHNIGFRIVDALAYKYHATWHAKQNMKLAQVTILGKDIILVKPQTFMNHSGAVISYLTKQGIKSEQILVVHDELELPFGDVKVKFGGSAKGHNGLKSIIGACSDLFARLRVGIDRPEYKEQVPDWVLQNFNKLATEVNAVIDQSITIIEAIFA